MSDFLHNLRNNSKDRRYDRTRKNYSGNQYNSSDRRTGGPHGRRKPDQNLFAVLEQLATLMVESHPSLQSSLKDVAESYKRLADADERKAAAQERQAEALESIVTQLRHKTDSVDFSTEQEVIETADHDLRKDEAMPDMAKKADEAPDEERQRVMMLIKEMREQGTSFSQIALFLEKANIPTFSGKGRWHSQTVSKLCQ